MAFPIPFSRSTFSARFIAIVIVSVGMSAFADEKVRTEVAENDEGKVIVLEAEVSDSPSKPCPTEQQAVTEHDSYAHRHQLRRHSDLNYSYGGGGVPLHRYDAGDGYSGRNAGWSSGYYGRAHSSPAVEVFTGVPGVRVSEWPSTTTGLTLTEEQHLRIGQVSLSQTTVAPQSSTQVRCSDFLLPFKKPYINIPDHVW